MSTQVHETQPIRDEIENLARNAPPFITPAPDENPSQANKRLAAGLNRVRGQAIQRAKAAHTRLRRRAITAITLSFAIGVSLGYLFSLRGCANARR